MPGEAHQRAKPDPDPAEQSDHGYRWSIQDSAGGVLRALSPEVYSNPEDAGSGRRCRCFDLALPGVRHWHGRLRLTSQQPWAQEVLPVDAFDCAISVN